MQWVMGLCENLPAAERVVDELVLAGFAPTSIAVQTRPQGIWSRMGCRPNLVAGRSFAIYRHALTQGRALVFVRTADEHAPRAIAQLNRLEVQAIQCCQAIERAVAPAVYQEKDRLVRGPYARLQALAALVAYRPMRRLHYLKK